MCIYSSGLKNISMGCTIYIPYVKAPEIQTELPSTRGYISMVHILCYACGIFYMLIVGPHEEGMIGPHGPHMPCKHGV